MMIDYDADENSDQSTPTVQQPQLIQPALQKRNSFNADTIMSWSTLQDDLQLQYSLLNKENETKNERIQLLINTLTSYYQTLLRFKDLKRLSTNKDTQLSERTCVLGYQFDTAKMYVDNLLFMLMQNQSIFAQIVYHSNETQVEKFDEFIFDVLTFLYDPIVGAGLESGIFVFLRELLHLEMQTYKTPSEFFEKSQIGVRFLIGFSKRPECQAYLQQVLASSLNLLMNVKESLELNPRNIYEQLQSQREAKENSKKQKQDTQKHRKNFLQKIHQYVMGEEELASQEMVRTESGRWVKQTQDVSGIIEEIAPAIQSLCQTPLGRLVDQSLLEEVAQILNDRRQVCQMILNSISKGLLSSLHKLPFIIRAIAQLLLQLFKLQFPEINRYECNNILTMYILNKWVIPEFNYLFLNNCPIEMSQYSITNVSVIAKNLMSLWRRETLYGLNVDVHYNQIDQYLQDLIVLPTTQLNYYIKEKSEKHFQAYMLSLNDLQIIINMIHKSKLESRDITNAQLVIYKDLRKLCENITLVCKNEFAQPTVQFRNQKHLGHNVHFITTKLSEVFQVNYLDTAFKLIDQQKIKERPKEEQEELLFIGKAKQVVAQFLISIDRISLISKLRDDVIVSFDNLIYMYKDSYESKGIAVKQYENISAQLYANYLMSIYKMIPPQYTSNNLIRLCKEIESEFTDKIAIVKQQQKLLSDVYIKIYTQLQSQRDETKAHNKLLKKTELHRNVLGFYKSVKIPCVLIFKQGYVSLDKIKELNKYKILDPTTQQKQIFLTQLNETDINLVNSEIAFQNIRDFIDLLSGMSIINKALMGDTVMMDIISALFQNYLGICEDKLSQQPFYMQIGQSSQQDFELAKKVNPKLTFINWSDRVGSRQKQYQQLCFEQLEKLIVTRIITKLGPIFKEDVEFHELCLIKQQLSYKEHGIADFQQENNMLLQISKNLKQIDSLVTPLDKLECIYDAGQNVLKLLQISGIGSGSEGQDEIIPLLIYLIVMAAPKHMQNSINLIKTLLNQRRWQNSKYGFTLAQLVSCAQAIREH